MTNRPSVAPTDVKGDHRGGPHADQGVLWVQFLVGVGSSHTKALKMGVVPACMTLRMK